MPSNLTELVTEVVWPVTEIILCGILIYVFIRHGIPRNEKKFEGTLIFFRKHWERFVVSVIILALVLFFIGGYKIKGDFWWLWIIVAILVIVILYKITTRFFPSFEVQKHVTTWFNAKKIWNVVATIFLIILGLGLWWYISHHVSSLDIRNPFASQAKTVTIPPVEFSSFGALDTDGGENRMKSGVFLGYTIPYADQVAFTGFDFSTKDGEWIKIRFEKFTNRRVWWEVMYETHDGVTTRKALSPSPYPDAKAGQALVTLISSSGYPAVLYVNKVY